ncbi:hypothetical protein Q0Z83_054130 [Actinoplanes sichuanensis]|nr:hypothetical protein Q0Z83_054130 [Actinoplanes sichuanensis]
MVAAGTAVAGHDRHAEVAAHCAQAIVRQQLSLALPPGGKISVQDLLSAQSLWEQWRLPTGHSPRGQLVVANITDALARLAAVGDVVLRDDLLAVRAERVERWVESLVPPVLPPPLDAYQTQYCRAASQAYHDEYSSRRRGR